MCGAGPKNFFSAGPDGLFAACPMPRTRLRPSMSEWLGLVDQQAQHLQLLAGYNRRRTIEWAFITSIMSIQFVGIHSGPPEPSLGQGPI